MKKSITVSVFTLGCKTNLYESRQLVQRLQTAGYDAFEGLKRADVFVINTCAVTNEAERKSRQAVSRCKKLNPEARILVCGCASQRDVGQFGDGVKLVKGTANKTDLADNLLGEGIQKDEIPSDYCESEYFAAHCKTRDFIKIQDGCDNFCSYCVVPFLRGRSRSRACADVVAEAESSVAKEIVLTGVDISSYGKHTDTDLAALCLKLSHLKARKRLGSLEVGAVSDRLLDAMEGAGFCPHFHLSLQSGSASVLGKMNRHYTPDEYLAAVEKIRARFPLAGLTTDVIVAFPSETDEHFAESLAFCEKAGFSDLHVFPFSPREGTVAARMSRIDAKAVRERVVAMTELKQRLKGAFLKKNKGTDAHVLTEECVGSLVAGYTDNYIRVYADGAIGTDKLIELRLGEPILDGCVGESVSQNRTKSFDTKNF